MHKVVAVLSSLVAATAGMVGASSPASAGADCAEYNQWGECVLYVEVGGGDDEGAVEPVGDDGTGGEAVECTENGQVVPCTWDGGIWSSEYGCYITPASADIPKSSGFWGGHTDGGVFPCYNPRTFYNTFVWLADPPAGVIAPPDPEELAEDAVATMNLRMFDIGITPKSGPEYLGYVGLPTWLWVADQGESTWGPISRSASAGGITVTATGRVDRVVWKMGDGDTVTCNSAGTPYHVSYGDSDSPDCGYRYTQNSADQPNNAYTVTATSYWVIEWAGGGESGQITMDFSDSAQIRIGELQAIGQQ